MTVQFLEEIMQANGWVLESVETTPEDEVIAWHARHNYKLDRTPGRGQSPLFSVARTPKPC